MYLNVSITHISADTRQVPGLEVAVNKTAPLKEYTLLIGLSR